MMISRTKELAMEKDEKRSGRDPEQLKWDDAGPGQASGRKGGAGGDYNEGHDRPAGSARPDEMREGKFQTHHTGASQEGMSESLGGPGGGTNAPSTREERRFGGSHTAGTSVKKPEDSEWKGGTPDQGPTSGGMGAAGGGHDTNENDVWGTKDRTDK